MGVKPVFNNIRKRTRAKTLNLRVDENRTIVFDCVFRENNAMLAQIADTLKLGSLEDFYEGLLQKCQTPESLLVALINSAKFGLTDFLEYILSCHKIPPSLYNNYALLVACEYGHVDTIRLLLQHPQFDPTHNGSVCLFTAIKKRQYDAVRLLLDFPIRERPFSFAPNFGETTESFMTHFINTTVPDPLRLRLAQDILIYCVKHRRLVCLKMLLRDFRFDPTYRNNLLLDIAMQKSCVKSVQILLDHRL